VPQAFLNALLGGALIGLSASVLLVVDGRVAGISGILGGVLQPRRGETGWRVAFLTGLLAGAGALAVFYRRALSAQPPALPTVWLVVAGLLVGVGTQLASGCTSGHGVCGLSRLSKRSVAAVMSFMIAAAVTTYFIRHVLAVSS
jgi:uncharacterized membrane protein YedE/YeeE